MRKLRYFGAFLLLFISLQSQAYPDVGTEVDSPLVILMIPDTAASTGVAGGLLRIRLSNFSDTVVGFQFVLRSERPELVWFDFSSLGFDTAGTMVSGFEYVQAIDRAGDQSELWFRCIANIFYYDGYDLPGIPPQQNGTVVYLPFNTTAQPDTLQSLTAQLTVTTPFDFSDPWGNSIGVVSGWTIDTIYYLCTAWVDTVCLNYDTTGADSLNFDTMIVDSAIWGYLDSSLVFATGGSVTLLPTTQIPCDNDGDGQITIVDLTCWVDFLFGQPAPGSCPLVEFCDGNGDGSADIIDLTWLVDMIFGSRQ